jgi:hypothetical protein
MTPGARGVRATAARDRIPGHPFGATTAMSTPQATPRAAPAAPSSDRNDIRIVSHSGLFYWWPVWAVGLILGVLTLFGDRHMAVVPARTALHHNVTGTITYPDPAADEGNGKTSTEPLKGQDVLVAPEGKKITQEPSLHVSQHKTYGVLFATVLLLVIAITNIPMRGLWSVIVIVVIVSLVIILALMGAWDPILTYLGYLDIRMTAGGYFLISGVLFVVWLVIFLFFDQQVYMVFSPGQFRVRLEIGEGETAYDTTGMTLQKQRSDLFRHWILGLGSGDLIVRTAGAQTHQFDLHNVLFVGRRLREIEEMLRSRAVVAGRPE